MKFKPFLKQEVARNYLNNSYTNEILYWGWARWGKSYFWCAWIIICCIQMPWSAWLIWRNELKRLRQTTLLTFFEVLKDFWISREAYKYNAMEWTITFINWSIVFLIDLSYMPSDPNYDRLWSYWLTWSFLDESQEINFKAINVLKGRFSVLEKNWRKTIPKTLYTCNPARNWIYTEFYKKWRDWTLDKSKIFIPSLVTDNPYINKSYIDNLKKADKVTVERLLYWNFEYDDTPWKLYDYDAVCDLFTNPKDDWDKYITADIAREWKDKTTIYVWKWRYNYKTIVIKKSKLDVVWDKIEELANEEKIPMRNVIVDEDWVGWWVVDKLKCKWFINNSKAIQPKGAKKDDTKKVNYENLKTQCYFYLQSKINESEMRITLPQEYHDELTEEFDAIVEIDIDKDWTKKIIRKKDIKQKIWRSPDFADWIMMRSFFDLKPKKNVVYETL